MYTDRAQTGHFLAKSGNSFPIFKKGQAHPQLVVRLQTDS